MRSVLTVVLGLALVGDPPPPDLPLVRPNDNRQPAGTRRGDTLVLALDIRMARWYPEANDGPSLVLPVFATKDGPPEVPGPLIRVSSGTQMDVTVHNALADSTVTVHGFVMHPGTDDSVSLAPGESRRLKLAAGAPGTYLYWASAGSRYFIDSVGQRDSLERDQLAGAFIVDSGPTPGNDRVFVMNLWGDPKVVTPESPELRRSSLTINGKSWPYTERLSVTTGDSVHWRVINATTRIHPMHLHGFYFRVDARGNSWRDSTVPPPARRLAVTDEILPGETRLLAWVPNRPGNWLFHCHIAFHVVPPAALLDPEHGYHGPTDHMAGLVLGISARPGRGWVEPDRRSPRRVAFTISELTPRTRGPRAIGVAIGTSAVTSPGPALVLVRGEPTDVTVRNLLRESTAIHWHGLELESYSDGVAGWSGAEARVAPEVPAGDSFVARLTQPRAGTFIYHTHVHDVSQLTAGLYGPILVLEPGETFDPARDHVFLVGWDGPQLRPINLVLNGDTMPPPLELAAGVMHRLRFINIGAAQRLRFTLLADTSVTTWRPVSRDGAALAPAQAVTAPAAVILPVGSTFDTEFIPAGPGEYRLTIGVPAPGVRPAFVQRLVVR
jgi:FtsP/CotA-like multicopper oxidase with cupredoxin domain